MSQLSRCRRACAFLEAKGFEDIEFRFSMTKWGMHLDIENDNITADEMRRLKRIFGPFEVEEGYQQKNYRGKVILGDEGGEISLKINGVYTCKELDPKDLTEEKWDEIKEHARHGRIKLQDCVEAPHRDA